LLVAIHTAYEVNEFDELTEILYPCVVKDRLTAPRIKPTGRSNSRRRAALTRDPHSSIEFVDGDGASAKRAPKVAIPVRTKAYKALAAKPARVKALIERYGEAFEKSRKMGRRVSFRVDVEPDRTPKITAIEGEDAPEASVGPVSSDLKNALAAARQRGRGRVAEILSADDMLSADALAALLGTTRVTVNTKRQNHQLLGLEGAKRGYRFPAWQIGPDGKPFSAIPHLFRRLGGDPWAVYRFLVQHHPELDGLTGHEALRRGKAKQAIASAESTARAFS
jgi:hypothetical protein